MHYLSPERREGSSGIAACHTAAIMSLAGHAGFRADIADPPAAACRPRAGAGLSLHALAAGRFPLPASPDLLGICRRGARPLRPVGRLLDDARAAVALPPLGHLRHRPRARGGAHGRALVSAVALRPLVVAQQRRLTSNMISLSKIGAGSLRQLTGPETPLAEKAWQKYCTQILLGCVDAADGKIEWDDARKQLISLAPKFIPNREHQRIIIADAPLTRKNLEGFNFQYCYITRTWLDRADLSNCNFRYAILRECHFNNAKAYGTSFYRADAKICNFLGLMTDSRTNVEFSYTETRLDPELEDKIEHARLLASQRNAPTILRWLNLATDFGRGIRRLLVISALTIGVFVGLYSCLWFFDPKAFDTGVGATKITSFPIWNLTFLSFERFFNASPWLYGVSPVAHCLTTLETGLGLLAFALFVSMLVRRMWRR
jgi:hypothetical protein